LASAVIIVTIAASITQCKQGISIILKLKENSQFSLERQFHKWGAGAMMKQQGTMRREKNLRSHEIVGKSECTESKNEKAPVMTQTQRIVTTMRHDGGGHA